MILACPDPECDSHTDDHPLFRINVCVGAEGLTEPLHHLEPEDHVCVYCDSKAIEGGAT